MAFLCTWRGSSKIRGELPHDNTKWLVVLTLVAMCAAASASEELLSVRPTQDPDPVAKNLTSFNCNTYSSCTECVSSSFSCNWCVDGHRCTHDTAENCRSDLVTGVSRIGPSYRVGPSFCPRINSASDNTNEIFVPSDVKKAVKVKVHIIGQFIVHTRFVCEFNIEGRVTHVNAQLLADTIYCDSIEFTYKSNSPNVTASLDVIWGGSKSLDNPQNTHILIYRCNVMADNCTSCLNLPEKFGCGWCQVLNKCEVNEKCGSPSAWLDRSQTCPSPEIQTSTPNGDDTTKNTETQVIPRSTTPRPDTAATKCNTYSSCTECVSSSFPCDWCVDGHRCTHDTAENCHNDILVTGVSRIGPSYRSGPGFCPTINSASDNTNEILVPSGVKKAIKVKVHIIGQFIVQTRFVCQFNIEGRVTHVNAQLLADTIYCDSVEFTYTSNSPNVTASLDVIWGGSKSLDNPQNTHILIYRCNVMADNCTSCLNLPEKFGCGWCQVLNKCEVKEKCGSPSAWLDRSQTCPSPEIQTFTPNWDDTTKNTETQVIPRSTTPRPDTAATKCNTYSSCTECVSSSFPCDWCVDGHRCTHDTAENCHNDILVTGVSRIGPSYRSGPGFCPTINSASDNTNEILVPSGVKKAIKVKVHIIGQFIVQTRFVCQFNIEGRVTHVNAQLLADTIYCDSVEFTYTSNSPNVTASLDVIWGGSKSLDNPQNTHILIYRCNVMADNCTSCLNLPEKFGCGWCQVLNKCEVKEKCGSPSAWLDRSQTCPSPEIQTSTPNGDDTTKNTETQVIPRSTTPRPDTAATKCNTYSSCTECVSSSFSCNWCVDGHRCTHDTAENCRSDLVTGVSRIGPSYRVGPSFCPRINSASDNTNEIFVPSDVKKAVKVKVHIIGQFIVHTRFVCEFNIEGRVTHVNAQLLADTIYCDSIEFTYTSNSPNVTASLDVIWGGSKSLDNPQNTHILIYRCNVMADNCTSCLNLPEKFGCGWCQGSKTCKVQEQCKSPNVWLNRTETCHNPNIIYLDRS